MPHATAHGTFTQSVKPQSKTMNNDNNNNPLLPVEGGSHDDHDGCDDGNINNDYNDQDDDEGSGDDNLANLFFDTQSHDSDNHSRSSAANNIVSGNNSGRSPLLSSASPSPTSATMTTPHEKEEAGLSSSTPQLKESQEECQEHEQKPRRQTSVRFQLFDPQEELVNKGEEKAARQKEEEDAVGARGEKQKRRFQSYRPRHIAPRKQEEEQMSATAGFIASNNAKELPPSTIDQIRSELSLSSVDGEDYDGGEFDLRSANNRSETRRFSEDTSKRFRRLGSALGLSARNIELLHDDGEDGANERDVHNKDNNTRNNNHDSRPTIRRNSSIANDIIHESQRHQIRLPAYIEEQLQNEGMTEEINREVRRRSSHLLVRQEEFDLDIDEDDDEDDLEDGNKKKRRDRNRRRKAAFERKKIILNGQWLKMKSTADWWSLWIGLASFLIAILLVFIVPYDHSSYRAKYIIPRPMRWETNPFDAWDWYSLLGTFLLLGYFCSLYLAAMLCMGKLAKNPASMHAKGFFCMGGIATLSLWVGSNRWCSLNGLSYSIWSILFGMIITNTPLSKWESLSSLRLTSKFGEFFIKCSLTLLAIEFSILAEVGLPAIVLAWVGSPLALILGYLASKKLFKMDTDIALLTAVGATWCGASAISATGSVIEASSSDITLSISVVAFFTVIFTFVQPYIALGVGMDEAVAGAWIGASVDQTGNVIASAAIISEYSTEVAGIVKIILNSGLGILCTIIAFWWQTRTSNNNGNGKKFSWLFLWDKFPKFVLGYFFCSGILSLLLSFLRGTAQADALQRAVIDMNKWWFAIGFVGIGVGTNLNDLWNGASTSGVIQGYLVSNLLDIGIGLGLSYALFN